MSTATHPLTPRGATYLGRGEIIRGKAYLEFLDQHTSSNFTVIEQGATAETVQLAQRACRERYRAAGAAFGPVSSI